MASQLSLSLRTGSFKKKKKMLVISCIILKVCQYLSELQRNLEIQDLL